jgi:hypothetical protein
VIGQITFLDRPRSNGESTSPEEEGAEDHAEA